MTLLFGRVDCWSICKSSWGHISRWDSIQQLSWPFRPHHSPRRTVLQHAERELEGGSWRKQQCSGQIGCRAALNPPKYREEVRRA